MRHFKGISQLILVLAILFAGFQFQPASAADYEVLVLYPSGPFNAKIPANATYTPETRIGVVKHSLEAWSTTIYRVNSGVNVPLVKITNYFSGRVENWPIPTYAMPSTGDDRSMVVFHYGSGYSYEFWDAKWVNSTTMTAGGMVKFPLNGTGIGTKNQRVSASGFAASAGMIVMEDFYNPVTGKIDPNGRIDHALTASLPASVITSGYVSPAVGGESSGKAGAGGIDVGMRFTLPRDLNVDALNIHPLTREILRAIRDYGLYINDGNGTPAYNGKAIATPRIEPGLSEILYGVPSDNLVNRLTTETYAVIQQYGLYRVTGGSGTTPPTNTAPGVSVSQGTVTVNEGQNATLNGAVGDKEGGALTMSASVGTVTNNNNGTWTWQMPTHDGPAQSQTVTVRATDSQGAVGQVTFNVSVQNVAPTGTLTLSIAQPKTGESTRVSFTGVTDPGSSDTTAGFSFRYDCKNDGTYEKTGASTTCTYTNPGTYTIKAQIVDKDNGAQTYTQSVTVGAASTVTPTPTTTTPTPTPTQTKTPTPTATTPVPTQTKTPTPTATTPVPTQTKTPTPPPTGSANPADFVLLGQEGVWVEKSSHILSGHVGANSEVALDSEVRVPNSSIFGDTLTFRRGVRVLNAYGNTITGGRVTGQKGNPTLPLVTMPPFPTFTATDDQIVVDYDQKLTLDAGTYGELEVRDDAEVIFTGGVYTFNRVEAWWAGTFTFLAPTEIRVTGQVKLNGYTKVLPAAGVNPSQVVWFVAGQNDTNNPFNTPTAVQIGNNTVINANFYAPNGTIYLNNRTQATGAFIGRWVRIGQRVQLNHASAFGAPVDFAAYNQNSVSPATVAAPQMQVAFTPDVISGTAPLTVTFANHSTGDILTQVWDFGDTTVSEEVSPAHTFTVAGEYTVTLTTMATDGTTQIAQTVISVAAPAPVYVAPTASFVTNVTEGVVPLTVNFTNLSTGDIQSVVWDFGDGTTSAENNPIRTFTAVGQYVVRLTVTGMDGSQQGTEVTINATQPVAAPTAAFVTDILTGTAPLTVQFTNQSTGDIAGYWWDFGDGASSSDANPAYTYLNAGQYTVTLTVTGVDGSIQVAQTVISASDPAPVYVVPTAAFVASAIDGVAPLAVQFTNQSTGDIASYWWDFGDGASSSDANPAYTYLNAGQYTVTLTVTGLDGSFQTAQLLINVQPTPQTAAPEVPQFAVPLECQHIVFSGAPIINGDGNDWIYGTEGNDLIYAGNGHNVVFGYGGDDCIIAADGHDTVEGGAGNDVIFGDGGSDDMYGDAGDDLLIGGDVSDAYYGGEGNDTSRTYDPNIDWMHDSIEVTQ